MLLVHALEMSDDPERLLREVWRVLAPSGRLIAVIPNRRGVWTRTDNTPFGHGRPYSRAQITQLLRQTWFTPASWGEALFMPPVGNSWFLRSAMAWERAGAALSLPFAGVHIVEATKQVYRAIPAHRERTRLIPSLEPVLVPSSTATRDKANLRSRPCERRDPNAAVGQEAHERRLCFTSYRRRFVKRSVGRHAHRGRGVWSHPYAGIDAISNSATHSPD